VTRRLLLVRHGATAWNREGRFQGHLDPTLDDEGRTEARLLAERLRADPDCRPARIVSSPLRRALETAEILADGSAVGRDRRLMEIGQGEWEGRTHRELVEADSTRYQAWREKSGGATPPGGESIDHALRRIGQAIDDALAEPGWPLCIVSHGGILRLLARHLLGLDHARAWGLDLSNASLSVLDAGDAGWSIERWNDVQHILAAEVSGTVRPDDTRDRDEEGEPLAL
jgi:glucosyl-3-phosphoglycerate phosphatase